MPVEASALGLVNGKENVTFRMIIPTTSVNGKENVTETFRMIIPPTSVERRTSFILSSTSLEAHLVDHQMILLLKTLQL